jgi:hypothetical protein
MHTVTAATGGQVVPSGRAQIDLPPESIAELRSALLQIDADDRDTWIRVGHALATIKDEASAFDAWLHWSSTSDKFDYHDATRVWLSFQPHGTGPQAIFAEAQRRGWKNPRAGRAAPDRGRHAGFRAARRRSGPPHHPRSALAGRAGPHAHPRGGPILRPRRLPRRRRGRVPHDRGRLRQG